MTAQPLLMTAVQTPKFFEWLILEERKHSGWGKWHVSKKERGTICPQSGERRKENSTSAPPAASGRADLWMVRFLRRWNIWIDGNDNFWMMERKRFSQKPFDLNDLIWKERKYFDRWKGNILCKRKERVSRSQWLWLWRLLIAKTFRMIGFVRKGNMCQSTKEGVLCRCNKNLFNQSILSWWREFSSVPFTS